MRSWRHLSIATRLPLAIAGLLLVFLAGLGFTAYLEVRRGAEIAASERLQSVSRQLGQMLGSSAGERLVDLDSLMVSM
ncbi:MAG: hypothetical protein ACREL7_09595, partial [Longimicrobiales bacterium]